MSKEAVKWAMDDAPMLLTGKGKPDSTSRHVLQVLAEHAHKDGSNAFPALRRLRYRTGYDRSTVQRALRRLEDAKLITATGVTEYGVTIYQLALTRLRPASDMAALEAEDAAFREAAAERKRRSRAKSVTHSAPVTVTDSGSVTDGDVTDSESVRHALKMRDVTDSESVRHTHSAALTSNEPPLEPPANPRPNGRRPTTGSADLTSSGSAALAKQHPDEAQNAVSAEAVGCVIGLLPRTLREQLPNPVPRAVTDAITTELSRDVTPDTLIARAERRWLAHGYDLDNDTQGGGPGLLRPVGVAVALIRRGKCTHARCDDGTDLDTGKPCRTCEREAEDRRRTQYTPVQGAFLAPVPAPKKHSQPAPLRNCDSCDRAFRSPQPGLCRDCRATNSA